MLICTKKVQELNLVKTDNLPIADHILDSLLHNILLLDNKLIIHYANHASHQFF